MQIGHSSSREATQQVLLEALPPILVLHLERFVYDAASEGTKKMSKRVQFGPELEIPLGTTFSFVSLVLVKTKDPSSRSVQKSWHMIPGTLQSRA